MTGGDVLLTGFASITGLGPSRGLPAPGVSAPLQPMTRWATPGPRQACLVPAFRPGEVVPGLRTRRIDRLSAWALVGSALALQDAGLDLAAVDGERIAVVWGTSFGCLDLTGEFLGSLATSAAQADPILFPETLANLPASHVAKHFGLRGPNITISAGRLSGEAALIEAVSLLRTGAADRAVVVAGDTLTRSLYEWYEAAGALSSACTGGEATASRGECLPLVPGEGLVACVIETAESVAAAARRAHGRYRAGWMGGGEPPGDMEWARSIEERVGRLIDTEARPDLVVIPRAADSVDVPSPVGPAAVPPAAGTAGEHEASRSRFVPAPEFGEFGGAGLMSLGVALAMMHGSSASCVAVAGRTRSNQAVLVVSGQEAGG